MRRSEEVVGRTPIFEMKIGARKKAPVGEGALSIHPLTIHCPIFHDFIERKARKTEIPKRQRKEISMYSQLVCFSSH